MKIKGFADTIKWYDDNSESYANQIYKKNYVQDVQLNFLKLLPRHPAILDAGCGPGRDSGFFYAHGAQVTGLDLSEKLLLEAKKRNPEVRFVKGNFLNLSFSDNSFDGIWAHAALVHLEEISEVTKALEEFYRVLKPNGILHIYVKAQKGEEKTAIVTDSISNHDRYFRYFSKEEMETYIKKSGFIIRDSQIRKSASRTELLWINIFAEKQILTDF